jgi:carbonic anhydrase
MGIKTNNGSPLMCVRLFAAVLVAVVPVMASAAWQVVATEQGKRVEIDRSSIVLDAEGMTMARGRIVLDKPIVDPKTSSSYRIIEVVNRFDCAERTHATLKRIYYKEEDELLRQEEVRTPYDMPVRSGTPDDKLLREVCRPKPGSEGATSASKTAEKVGEVAGDLRKLNEALVEKEVRKDLQRLSARAGAQLSGKGGGTSAGGRKSAASAVMDIAWAYDGNGGPDNWSKLKAEYALCASGRRQSPIDLREGIAVDLEPIQFFYRPASFRVVDGGRNLQMSVYGGGLSLLGKSYELIRVHFHRPSEITVAGKAFDMDAQLLHKSEDGKLAIVTVLLEKGKENPVVQMALNNLPLEKGGEVMPPGQSIDVDRLLPANRQYFTFIGSLSTPPCSEDVLWLVLKQPQQISPEQQAIFERLYKPNARPVQPGWGRIVKESR